MPVLDTTKAQVTAIPHVVDALCQVCGKCVARDVCRSKAILRIDPDEPPFIDPNRCYGCRVCIAACPHGAIVAGDQEA
jgi:MinD superfamily P-loop ATPase